MEEDDLDFLITESDIKECRRKIRVYTQELIVEHLKLEIMTGDYVDKYNTIMALDRQLIKILEKINKEFKVKEHK